MGSFGDLAAQFDPVDNNRKGKQFEAVCKWFLQNDPAQYKPLLRRIWMWKDWPGNWGIDAGIDLIAEDNTGGLWAIQAKAYTNRITRAEVNKFLAEASRFNFAHLMLMATIDDISPTARRTMEDLNVTFIGLTELEEFQEWPTRLADLRPAKPPKPKQPWDYQRSAIRDVTKGFESADRGQLIMACGTGKTLTSWFIREKLAAERTLVLVPSLSLLKQTLREWRTANIKKPFDALPVCSDTTVGNDDDAAISHISYLGEPATTDPQLIAKFLRKRTGRPRVVFATYQSSPQIEQAFNLGRTPAFDLAIADEAHRVAGSSDSEFATILDAKKIKAKRRLFMTATPRYPTGRSTRGTLGTEDEIASMDDPAKFGDEFHKLGFSKAIQLKLLTDYQVAIIGVDHATYQDWAERGKLLKLNGKKTDARALAGQIGLAKAMRKYDLRRVISFHGRVNRAKKFADSLQEVIAWMPARQRPKGPLWADYVSGKMTAEQRHRLLQHLTRLGDRERIGLLANARCLAEGVDVPTLDGVAFIDPRRAEVDIVQAVGRAIRKSDKKLIGTVVIPIFVESDQDPEVALDDSAFKPVWDVVKALRAHDDELGRQLDELRRELGRQGGRVRLPAKIHLDLFVNVSASFARAFDVRLVEQTTQSWQFWFGLLQTYVKSNGDALVPQAYKDPRGYRLGTWVAAQRRGNREGWIRSDRKKLLEEVHPTWSWFIDPDDSWELGFQKLVQFIAEKNHARVAASYKTPDGYRLGSWVNKQRTSKKDKSLSQERVDRLESLGPKWSWDARGDRWEEGFALLQDYVDENHTALVPDNYKTADGFALGKWVGNQRTFYNKNKLLPDRLARLESVHPTWTWDRKTAQWENGFDHLVAFVIDQGHARPAQLYKSADGFGLGSWVGTQRLAYRKDKLDQGQIQRLEAIHPTWMWDPRIEEWENAFQLAHEYVDRFGDARIKTSYKTDNGFALGGWVAHQRQLYAKGKLDADRAERLEQLHPTWSWDTNTDKWEDGFEHLAAYIRENKHARVPSAYKADDGYRLGAWVTVQRTAYNQNKLTADRQKRLEGVHPTWVWDALTQQWQTGYECLRQYAKEHGDTLVNQSANFGPDNFGLGAWVSRQRREYKQGKLSAERIKALKALPGWDWAPSRRKRTS